MSYRKLNRLFINTDSVVYDLTPEEIKNDPVVFFNSTSTRTVTLNFPSVFDSGYIIEAHQSFDQGLGDIVIAAPFKNPDIETFRKPDFVRLVSLPNSKVKIVEFQNTICAYAYVDPSLFINGTNAEITSYQSRYRLRLYNTGSSSLQFGLDDIPIESGWSGISRYNLELKKNLYVPKNNDAYYFQYTNWASSGGQAPEGGRLIGNFTKFSNDSKTVDITDNANGSMNFTLYKNTKFTFL